MKKPKDKKSGVRVNWSKKEVVLLERGEKISMIRWKDAGTEQAIPNDQLGFD